MNGNILFIIFFISIIAIIGCIYILVDIAYKLAKTKKKSTNLNVGDVLLSNFSKNPFKDAENKYETVTEVRRNDDGNIYFLSYTSDKTGKKSLEQDQFCAEHSYGRRYWPEDWEVVNHIEIK